MVALVWGVVMRAEFRRPMIAATFFGVLAWHPSAQSQVPGCTDESKRPAFALTDANRLSAAQFDARILGKRAVFGRVGTSGSVLRLTSTWRADGSAFGTCEWRNRMGDWSPCDQTSAAGGGRDVATWRISDPAGILCSTRTGGRDRQEYCYSIHEQAGRFAMKLLSGTLVCLPGNFELQ